MASKAKVACCNTPAPLNLIFLAGALTLFLSALLSDIAYFNTFQIQWSNFSSWLIVGGLVLCGMTLLFALIDLVRAGLKDKRLIMYFFLLLCTWCLGLINALEHAKDAWAVMPSGLVLSALVTLLICGSTWLGFINFGAGETR